MTAAGRPFDAEGVDGDRRQVGRSPIVRGVELPRVEPEHQAVAADRGRQGALGAAGAGEQRAARAAD